MNPIYQFFRQAFAGLVGASFAAFLHHSTPQQAIILLLSIALLITANTLKP